MKRHRDKGVAHEVVVFPRIRAGASLKPVVTYPTGAELASFPPHSCGGLIEATTATPPPGRRAAVFPRIRAGASLKRRAGCF